MPVSTAMQRALTLALQGGFAVANPVVLDVTVADTLTVSCPNGKSRVVFDPWPFDGLKHDVADGELVTFRNLGPFTFLCHITPPGMPEVGYQGSGGTGNVRPPK